MSLETERTTVTRAIIAIRVVNRLAGFGMSFLGLRLAQDLGMPLDHVGWVLAAFGVATLASRLLGGVLAVRLGHRPTITGGLLACGTAQLLIGLAPSAPVVVVAVLFLGLAYEIIEPATQGLLAAATPPERRASTFALLWTALSVAGVLSGGLVAVVGSWGVAALFVVDAASSIVAAVVAAVLLRTTSRTRSLTAPATATRSPTDAATDAATPAAWRTVVHRPLLAWTAIATNHATIVMVVVFLLPVAVTRMGHATSTTGLLLVVAAAAGVAAQRLLRHLEDAVPTRVLLAAGHLALAAGLALWASGGITALVAGAALEGASGALLVGSYQARAARLAAPGVEAMTMAVFGLSWGAATVVAPLIGTFLLERGAATLWLATALASALVAVAFLAARPVERTVRGRVGVPRAYR